MYGHIESMAGEGEEGVRGVPEAVARGVGAKLNQAAPIATTDELQEYDEIIFGTPTRFGSMCAQMRNFLDQTGRLWLSGGLIGKVVGVFTSMPLSTLDMKTSSRRFPAHMLHHGMVIVGVPYAGQALVNMDEITGGSPYGAGTVAGNDGSHQSSENELEIARYQGRQSPRLRRSLCQRPFHQKSLVNS
jgi:NAD(P)H dehydrogenase (quinone)